LGEKNYQTAIDLESPDFVLLFIPIESSFGLAVQGDAELFNYAWDRKIVIVSPSTLLATLRTIASIWKQERQTRNAIEIAEEGGRLYDKFVSFCEDLIRVGKRMEDAKSEYNEAMKKLVDGTGNLVRRAEKMRELGAKTTKQLPSNLIERATD
jgi:DNA recombination protein RmuC